MNISEIEKMQLAKDQVELARERTGLANERTFLSWIRTGLASAAAGVAIIRFLSYQTGEYELVALAVGVCFIVLAVLMFMFGAGDYYSTSRELKQRKSIWMMLFLAGSMAILAAR